MALSSTCWLISPSTRVWVRRVLSVSPYSASCASRCPATSGGSSGRHWRSHRRRHSSRQADFASAIASPQPLRYSLSKWVNAWSPVWASATSAVASSFRASNSATFSSRNSTSGWEKSALEPVVKSVRRVPTPITKSACGASSLAAIPPVTPTPPRLSGWLLTNAPFPAWVSANGSRSVSTNSRNASCAPE